MDFLHDYTDNGLWKFLNLKHYQTGGNGTYVDRDLKMIGNGEESQTTSPKKEKYSKCKQTLGITKT